MERDKPGSMVAPSNRRRLGGLVGNVRDSISGTFLDTIRNDREEMRKLIAVLSAVSRDSDGEPQTAEDRSTFAQTLLALAASLDSHIERYDGEVLPSILRHF